MTTVKASGTQSCTLTTEHTLATVTNSGNFCVRCNFVNAVDGSTPDRFVVRAYTKCLTGSTEQLEQEQVFEGAQSLKNWCSDPLPSPFSVKYTLTQSTGASGRSVEWSVMQVDA